MNSRLPLVESLGPTVDPAEICARFLDLPYVLFLDSAATQHADASYSFLSADPAAVIRSKGAVTEVQRGAAAWVRVPGDGLAAARALLPTDPVDSIPGLPPFQAGLAGYIGYDWGAVLERLPRPRYDDLALPDLTLGLYDWVIAWDHRIGTAWLISSGLPEVNAARERRARERMDMVRERLGRRAVSMTPGQSGSRDKVGQSAPSYPVPSIRGAERIGLRSTFTRTGYLDAVRR